MGIVNNYILSKDKGPMFDLPANCQYQYSTSTTPAASVIDAWNLTNEVLDNVNTLNPDFEHIIKDINELEEYWNNFIKLSNEGIEYVNMDELNKDINTVNDCFDNGKNECSSMFYDFNTTIDEINSYLDLLSNNYNEYAKLKDECSECLSKALSHSVGSEEYQYYSERYKTLHNELKKYVKVSAPSDFGRWVEKK